METTVVGAKVTLLVGSIVSSTRGVWNRVEKPYTVTVTKVVGSTIFFSTIPGFVSFTNV